MTTAFDPSPFSGGLPVRSATMSDRLADSVVPLIGGHAPTSRRTRSARRATYVARPGDRILAHVATASLAVGSLLMAIGVTTLL